LAPIFATNATRSKEVTVPQSPDWKRVLETGMNFTEVHRSQAQKIAADLVSQGQLARDQLGAAVDEIVENSKRQSEVFRKAVRAEVKRQLELLHLTGVVPFDLAEEPKLRTGSTKKPAKKAPAKKQVAKKPAKKAATSAAKKAPAKKKAAKKPAAKKPAKKATAKKTVTTPTAKRAR
jgi:polyhydroxyalkanoate synthesis regulator phasin